MSTQHCDVVVVGLGAMGSAVIDQLAMRGINVVGLDRFNPPHDQGSSHGDTRISRQAVGEGASYVPFVLASQRRWKELEREMDEHLFEQCGAVIIGNPNNQGLVHGKADFFETTAKTADQFGIEHYILDRKNLVSKFPQFSGMKEDDIAYFEPGAGYAIPEKCISAQIRHAEAHNAKIHTNVTVKKIKSTVSGAQVITDNGVWEAKKVVVSTGAWISELLGEAYKDLLVVRRQVLHWFSLEKDEEFPANSPVYIWIHGSEESFYGFPPLPGEKRVKVAMENYVTSTDPHSISRVVTEDESREMFDMHLKNRLIGVSDNVDQTATCMYTVTPDHGFLLDYHPEMSNVFVVSACSGHGFKHSSGIGQAVAEEISGGKKHFDLSQFSLSRFYRKAHRL